MTNNSVHTVLMYMSNIENLFVMSYIHLGMGRFCIPQMVGRKLTEYFELIKPLVDFKYEVAVYLSMYSYIFYTNMS